MTEIVLRKIIDCSENQIKAVREIRNQENIRKAMYMEHEISLDEHLVWVERQKSDDKQIVFSVLEEEVVRGVVSVNAIDRLHLKSDWAFYLDTSARGGVGFGTRV